MDKKQAKQLFENALNQIHKLSLKTMDVELAFKTNVDETNDFFITVFRRTPAREIHNFLFFSWDEHEVLEKRLQQVLDAISTDHFNKVTEAYQRLEVYQRPGD